MTEILVGVDSSSAAQRALQRAAGEALAWGEPLHVVHAWTTPVWLGGVPGLGYNILASPEDSQAWAASTLETQLTEAHRQGLPELPLHAETVEGDAKQVLTELSLKASLLVVAGHGDGPVKGMLLGSVATHLLHHAHCPVMVVPDHGEAVAPVRRVVVGADGSAHSRAALAWAVGAARQYGCPLLVVHAWALSGLADLPMRQPEAEEVYDARALQWLDEELDEAVPDRDGVDVRLLAVHGTPAPVLLSQTGPQDLLVLGARGFGGFRELLLGSVAGQCAQHTHGTLVVVRAGERTGS